jgi:hypothetical protein
MILVPSFAGAIQAHPPFSYRKLKLDNYADNVATQMERAKGAPIAEVEATRDSIVKTLDTINQRRKANRQ